MYPLKFLLACIYLLAGYMRHDVCVKIRGQLGGVSSLLPCESWDVCPGDWAW